MKPEYTSHTANPIGIRLKIEMKKRGLTSTELARRADVLTSFLYDIISGKSSNPSTVKLARVADALGISLNQLVSGTDTIGKTLTPGCISIPRITVNTSAQSAGLVTHEEEGESYYFRESWIKKHLSARVEDMRLLYISGDSMEPTLQHQDIVLVDTGKKSPTPPGIFVLFDGMGLVAKRLEYVSDPQSPRIRIVSDNPHYSTYERSLEETSIIGRVVWFAREM